MTYLDKIDRKIVYELGKDARLSYKEIATRIKSKKEVVAYRFNNLKEKEIIWKFVPIFSLSRLGIYAFKIYFRFHGLNKEIEKNLISDLVNDSSINWVAKSVGTWDLLISTYACDIMEFAERKNNLFLKYGKYIQEYSVVLLEDALVFNRDYLLDKPIGYRKEFIFGGKPHIEKIDTVQQNILRLIKNDGRYQITELANKLNLNIRTVMSKITDLEKRKIIQGHTIFLRINKIGLQFFKICVYLQDYSKENFEKLLTYSKSNRNVIHLIKSIGNWELELELEAEEVNEVYNFINELKNEFPYIIKKIDLITITDEIKLDFFPEWY